MPSEILAELARHLSLGGVLEALRLRFGAYELVAHTTQGEFHHDVIVRVPGAAPALPGEILVVATNCNGGVKELLCFAEPPTHGALWHWRCPDGAEFNGTLPPLLDRAVTVHWFDPCELLTPEARSELRPEFRQRQAGGGWEPLATSCPAEPPKPDE